MKVYDFCHSYLPFFSHEDKQTATETKKKDASTETKENNASTETKKSIA